MLKLVFIDRDGVINKDPGGWTKHSYVTEAHELHFLPGALKALALLKKNGIKVVVVSNQAGVSKGYFTREKLSEVNARMLSEVAKSGGRIEEVFYCIHRDEDNCECRKPKPGMLEQAIRKYGVAARDTYIIGDSLVDVMAGKALGMKTIFVLSGKTTGEEMKRWSLRPDHVFPGLIGAVEWLLNKEARRIARSLKRRSGGRDKTDKGSEE